MVLFSLFSFVLLGILFGILTGLTPGLHPNTVAIILFSYLVIDPFLMSVLIVSTAVAHTFFDFIPSIMLGAPNPDTALSVLPGHKMMRAGKGYEAVYLTVVGGIVSLIIISLLLPVIGFFIKPFFHFLKTKIHWVLIGIVGFMFLRDKKIFGLVVFSLSGIMGLLVLRNNILGTNALFPMLTGFFGLSTIIYSMKETFLPPQKKIVEPIGGKNVITGGLAGSLSGILVGLLPGIGAAQATFLSQEVLRKKSVRRFMVAIGGVNTTVAIFSLLSLWLIGRPRSGVGVFVERLLSLSLTDVFVLVGVIIFVSGIAGALTLILSKNSINLLRRINYRYLNFSIIILISFLIFLFTGVTGILLALLSTLIGLVCILSGTRRTYLMGCLILPTVLFFLGI